MGYDEVWKTLADLITEFRRRGESIPPETMEDLRAAKTMIEVMHVDPNRIENIPSVEMYIEKVESYLMYEAHKKFGQKFVQEWMKKTSEARTTKPMTEQKQPEPASKFVPGLPRGQAWVRMQITAETPEKEIRKMAEETGLSHRVQRDGYVLVYGEDEKVKLFVKKATEKFGAVKPH